VRQCALGSLVSVGQGTRFSGVFDARKAAELARRRHIGPRLARAVDAKMPYRDQTGALRGNVSDRRIGNVTFWRQPRVPAGTENGATRLFEPLSWTGLAHRAALPYFRGRTAPHCQCITDAADAICHWAWSRFGRFGLEPIWPIWPIWPKSTYLGADFADLA
jgi:hypothetical protein